MPGVDPVEFEVIRHALVAAADEMCVALAKSAYSTNIKTRLDLSCGILDRHGRLIGQAAAQPCQLSAMNVLVPRAIHAYGPERLNPGDQLVVNDPYQGAVHLNDVVVIAPIFYQGEICGYAANLAHHVDVGGGSPGSLGAFKEVYQEGLIFPIVKLVENGRLHPDMFKLILANIRSKKETAGDFRAQIAANNLGARRMVELLDRFGLAQFETFVEDLLAYTEARSRAELRKLPDGVYEAEELMDDDGITDEPIRLRAKITVDDGRVVFDFTGSDPQRPSPMNATFTQTHASCVYVIRCLMDRDIPTNDGFYRLIEVIAPEGTVTNAQAPVGVAGGWEVSNRECDVLFKALAAGIPERVPAGCKAMVCHVSFGGKDPRSGEYYCFLETIAGGYGGRLGKDGIDASQTHHQNTQNAPVEEVEVGYPVLTTHYGLVPDSEGAGEHRGGLGVRRDYTFRDHEVVFTVLADRRKFPPFGLGGGQPGRTARYTLLGPDGQRRDLPSKTTFAVVPGQVVSYETCGGGGYGDPLARDPALVLRDVIEGKVTRARAREVYGLVVDPLVQTVEETPARRRRSDQLEEVGA
ncbi:MAG: hydantoinase B/oxoprolinase family protein [Chloroflexi bacterium]|nr:hydantoinase B/oxoprolinase family protein [Chloroflexota bacterium]